jgi:hypothetical protein
VTREEMLGGLKQFVVSELLDGRDTGVRRAHAPCSHGECPTRCPSTCSSAFTSERFGIAVPQSEVTPENLKDLDAYVAMLTRQT